MHFSRYKPLRAEKQPSKGNTLLGCKFVLLEFSATILRPLTYARKYATIADRKSKFKRRNERQKPIKESIARRKKRQPIPSGSAGTAPRRRAFGLVFRVVLVVFFVACAWLRRAQRAALVYAKHTPWCQTVKISEFIIVLPIIFLDRISSI